MPKYKFVLDGIKINSVLLYDYPQLYHQQYIAVLHNSLKNFYLCSRIKSLIDENSNKRKI